MNAQGLCTNPEKMPYLCIIGTHDFDELRAECMRLEEARDAVARIDDRLAHEWNPLDTSCERFEALRERIEQEEFARIQVGSTSAANPVIAEAEADYDPKQRASLTESLEFCGCKCFRSLSEARGFWFA